MEVHAMKFPGCSFRADVNPRGGLLCQQTTGNF